MRKYNETLKSRLLYNLNKSFLIRKQAPDKFNPQNILEICWKYLFLMFKFIHRNITDRQLYDKNNINTKDEYTLKNYYQVKDKVPKIVIYTCILGKYDNLYEPIYDVGYEFIAITDFEISSNSKWKRYDINNLSIPENLDNIRKARYIKTHPHEIFSEYDVSVWIDGNIIVMADIVPLILDMDAEKFFGVHLHPNREKLRTEQRAIISLKRKVDKKIMNEQIMYYEKMGYKDNIPLLETTILIRKHNDCRCINLMEDWWNEIKRFTTRDQISLPFTIWKNTILMKDIYILGENLKLNPRFRYMEHRK